MQFLVLGFDGTDTDAPARRQAARPDHLARGDQMLAEGSYWYGAALNDENGNMIGSAMIFDFPDRQALDDYLKTEPYVVGNVWEGIEILPCTTREPWQFNRPREFFEERANSES